MKTNLFFLSIFFALFIISIVTACSKDSEILPEDENIDPTLLVGEWNCIKFAYMADDKTISDVAFLSKGRIKIPDNMENKWIFTHTNEIFYYCSLSGNLIKFTMSGSTYVGSPQEEIDICEALENAYRLSIQDNILMIYFTGVENKNLLILEKQKS